MWKMTLLPKEKRPGIRPINISGWNEIPYHKLGQARLRQGFLLRQGFGGQVGGQVGIETSIAFVTIIIFLWGVTQLFLELNRSIVDRQVHYQTSRTRLGMDKEREILTVRVDEVTDAEGTPVADDPRVGQTYAWTGAWDLLEDDRYNLYLVVEDNEGYILQLTVVDYIDSSEGAIDFYDGRITIFPEER